MTSRSVGIHTVAFGKVKVLFCCRCFLHVPRIVAEINVRLLFCHREYVVVLLILIEIALRVCID